jgi:hypothetical protein
MLRSRKGSVRYWKRYNSAATLLLYCLGPDLGAGALQTCAATSSCFGVTFDLTHAVDPPPAIEVAARNIGSPGQTQQ